MTPSTPRHAFCTSSLSRISDFTSSIWPFTLRNLSSEPLTLLSITLTLCPSLTSLLTKALPIKPVPQVTRYFLFFISYTLSFHIAWDFSDNFVSFFKKQMLHSEQKPP